MKQTAEARAAKKYPWQLHETSGNIKTVHKRQAFATCIRDEVEPLEAWKESEIKVMGEWDKVWTALGNPGKLGESTAAASLAEVKRLRALVQVLVDGLHAVATLSDVDTDDRGTIARDPLTTAKQQGFVPTNTTEG